MTDKTTTTGDPMTAALLQLAAHGERLAVLDAREAGHHRALAQRLAELAALVTDLGSVLAGHAETLTGLDGIAGQIAALEGRLAGVLPPVGGEPPGYQPAPAPRWWTLTGPDREDVVQRVRAWTEQVYRPGYGQLAAALGPCWEQHPLCLYGLDVLSELWSVLYLPARRSTAVLSAQAEFQARIAPAIAAQLTAETTRCGHARPRTPVSGTRRTS